VRLQVFVSHSGVCSRRKALDLIREGRVTVDGQRVVEPSYDVASSHDGVCLDGKKLTMKERAYLMLNKPRGFVTTVKDRHAKHTVMELLPRRYGHLYPVGRLDKDSEGLLLFTNDGQLAFRLTHPRFQLDKVYLVQIRGRLKKDHLEQLARGVMLDGKRTLPAKVSIIASAPDQTELRMAIREGRKRQIRRMLSALGYRVHTLKRIQDGPLELGKLGIGKWRILSPDEVTLLRKDVGLDAA